MFLSLLFPIYDWRKPILMTMRGKGGDWPIEKATRRIFFIPQ